MMDVMGMKICSRCGIEKNIDSFYFGKNEKPRAMCIKCHLEQSSENYKIYYKNHKREKLLKSRTWEKNNRERRNCYKSNRRRDNSSLRLHFNISRAISHMLKIGGGKKNNISCLSHLPYTIEELKQWLESKFESWMNWDNYGVYREGGGRRWNIDHIIPQIKLPYKNMTDDNFVSCWALENLRPLDAQLNSSKGENIDIIPLSRNALGNDDINSLVEWLSLDPIPKLSQGEFTDLFERTWSRKLGVKYSVFVNSGSSANLIAIYALKLKYDIKKCVVPAVSWITTVSPLIQFGIQPILCDVDKDTLGIDPEKLEEICQRESPDALVVVHALGIPAKMTRIREVCDKYGVKIIEDSCESMESVHDGKKVGTFGVMSTFSLYYAHILCSVEGGFVSTDDKDLYDILVSIRSHAWSRSWNPETKKCYEEKYNIDDFKSDYTFYYPGFNVRNNEINAHLGLSQLMKLDKFCDKRRTLLQLYDKLIKNDYWKIKISDTDVGFVYPIITPKIERVVAALKKNNIDTRPIIAGNIGLQPFWKDLYGEQHFEFADIVDKYGCYVPIHHNITETEVCFICQVVNEALSS